MKILFQNREGIGWGGASHQITMLMDSLKQIGYKTQFSSEENFENCDLVHISHINLKRNINYTRCHKPIIIKCIWHTWEPRVDNSQSAFLAKKAEKLIVESLKEKELMINFLKSELTSDEINKIDKKTVIFKPGIDSIFQNTKSFDLRDKVHINGWHSYNKGQSEVIKACRDLNLPVVTAGPISDERYINYCKSFHYGEILDSLSKNELNKLYNETKVYVTASLYENHSASMCEAIACGCLIVSSSNHLANCEYDKSGFYVYEWGNYDNLKETILKAYYCNEKQENEYWTHSQLAKEYHKIFQNTKKYLHL